MSILLWFYWHRYAFSSAIFINKERCFLYLSCISSKIDVIKHKCLFFFFIDAYVSGFFLGESKQSIWILLTFSLFLINEFSQWFKILLHLLTKFLLIEDTLVFKLFFLLKCWTPIFKSDIQVMHLSLLIDIQPELTVIVSNISHIFNLIMFTDKQLLVIGILIVEKNIDSFNKVHLIDFFVTFKINSIMFDEQNLAIIDQ